IEVFSKIKKEKLDIGINFGCWSLPSKELIESISKTFNMEKTCISVSPESGSEKIRDINKGASYSNAKFYETIKILKSYGVHASCHFGLGFPRETEEDFAETLKMFRALKGTGYYLSIRSMPLEPGSPMYLEPERFGIEPYRRCFNDYYEYCRDIYFDTAPKHPFGYRTEHFSEDELSTLKIKAYRAFYLRPGFILPRLSWTKNVKGAPDAFKVGLATLIGSKHLLNKWER
ncbi:MAG TPA: radical SAM protein, partial [bacterium]|nr:radical SAM protein [bacterium]